jgi:AcrR family transcriptional regulator
MSSAPTVRRRLPADERRRNILDAARQIFAQRGYHGAGIAEIAAKCGCSEPNLYRHFPSKQALFAAVLLDAAELVRARVDPIFAESDNPLAAFSEVAKIASTDELFIEILSLRTLATSLVSEPEIRDALAQTLREMHARITDLMARSREQGLLRADVDPAEAAWLWLGISFQVGYRRAVFGTTSPCGAPKTAAALIALLTADRPAEETP